jgi:hypothetical protein
MNKVIGPRTAIIDGNHTAFAGCTDTACSRNCLRKDEQLKTRVKHSSDVGCSYFILREV